MKRSFNMTKEQNTTTSLIMFDGYVVNVNGIRKNTNNENHHYSFLFSTIDQTVVHITKFLRKIPSCTFYRSLRESMLSGHGACIDNLREQNDQYLCNASTKLIHKDLQFRPPCVRIRSLENLRNNMIDGVCTIEVKVCKIGPEIPFVEGVGVWVGG